jgi:hypothetical protein
MDEKYKACCFVTSAVVGAVVGGLIDHYSYEGDAWRGSMIGASIPTFIGIMYLIRYKITVNRQEREEAEEQALITETKEYLHSQFKTM